MLSIQSHYYCCPIDPYEASVQSVKATGNWVACGTVIYFRVVAIWALQETQRLKLPPPIGRWLYPRSSKWSILLSPGPTYKTNSAPAYHSTAFSTCCPNPSSAHTFLTLPATKPQLHFHAAFWNVWTYNHGQKCWDNTNSPPPPNHYWNISCTQYVNSHQLTPTSIRGEGASVATHNVSDSLEVKQFSSS